VAVREFPLKTGDADYMLYVDGRAVGVIEAKPEGHTLTGVETQSGKYLDALPDRLPAHRLPLPCWRCPPLTAPGSQRCCSDSNLRGKWGRMPRSPSRGSVGERDAG
jgi:hypothetical protein